MWESLVEPARLIAENAGHEGAVVVEQISKETGSIGFNAATGEFEDLVKAGIIDPAKVTRAALQNAASIAGLLLTTEVLVADKPEKKGAGHAARRWDGRHGWHGRHARDDVSPLADASWPALRCPGRGPSGMRARACATMAPGEPRRCRSGSTRSSSTCSACS